MSTVGTQVESQSTTRRVKQSLTKSRKQFCRRFVQELIDNDFDEFLDPVGLQDDDLVDKMVAYCANPASSPECTRGFSPFLGTSRSPICLQRGFNQSHLHPNILRIVSAAITQLVYYKRGRGLLQHRPLLRSSLVVDLIALLMEEVGVPNEANGTGSILSCFQVAPRSFGVDD